MVNVRTEKNMHTKIASSVTKSLFNLTNSAFGVAETVDVVLKLTSRACTLGSGTKSKQRTCFQSDAHTVPLFCFLKNGNR